MIPISDADAPAKPFAPVNRVLIGLNLVVFLYELLLGGIGLLFGSASGSLTLFFLTWGFIPLELTTGSDFQSLLQPGDIDTPIPTAGTLLTSMFIHGGFLHLAGNLIFLWVFGSNIEARIGHVKYLAFYLVTGVLAALTQWVVEPTSPVPMVGASGAIAGLMGAYLMFYPRNRINSLIVFYLITLIPIPALWLLCLWFVWQLVQGVLAIGLASQVNVAFWAHVGGFVAGAAIIVVYRIFTGQPPFPTLRGGRGNPGAGPRQPTKYWRGRPIN